MTIETWVLIFALAAIAAVFAWTLMTGSPPTPTSRAVRRTILATLPARLPGDQAAEVYELGAGWGGLALAMARRYPDRQIIGMELSPLPWLVSLILTALNRPANLTLRRADFLNADLSGASLVVCYLSADVLARLRPQLERQLRPGALIVSNTFAIEGWRPLESHAARDIYKSPVYLYEIAPRDSDPEK